MTTSDSLHSTFAKGFLAQPPLASCVGVKWLDETDVIWFPLKSFPYNLNDSVLLR